MIQINRKSFLFFLAVGLLTIGSVEAQNKEKSETALDKKVETLLKKMTLYNAIIENQKSSIFVLESAIKGLAGPGR